MSTRDRLPLRLFTCAQLGILSFLVLTIVSMFLYPGGTFRDRTTAGYSFSRNFLSDLGMPQAWSAQSNPIGAVLFVSGEVMLGVAIVAFFVAVVKVSATNVRARAWSRAAAAAALVVCLAVVAAGLTPANRFQTIHVEAALLAFRAGFVATGLLAVAIARDGRFHGRAITVAAILALSLAAYIGVLEFGPSARRSDYGLAFQATSQKLIVMVLLSSLAYLGAVGARVAKQVTERGAGASPTTVNSVRTESSIV